MTDNRKPNELIHATSPYLLQHAYNPVAWREWSPETLAIAVKEDKPILVSIGYSSCHWCHVMERESFEQEAVAQIMNDHFICIKVDREERPDIDQVYMESVQAMGGHGGWPLNVFLMPDQKPFYGGTYFPMADWLRILKQIHVAFIGKRKELTENADQLTQHLATSDLQRFANESSDGQPDSAMLEKMFTNLAARFDAVWGGLEKAPKFVMPSIWLFLLRYHVMTQDPEPRRMVHHTLTKMLQGGLYDQLGGGFSRYSVDGRWFAPHFEKMLYDNAQLITLYSEAFSLTKDTSFKRVVWDTIGWLKREMLDPSGGFYSALDADSENAEGKFYTWSYGELEDALGALTPEVAGFYHATREGNWEHGRNILMDTSAGNPPAALTGAIGKLLTKRNSRIHPGLDDKILAGWNGMMIKGLTDAYAAFGEPEFLQLAESGIACVEKNLINEGKIFRSFKGRRSETEGFLEDYGFVIQAYVALYQRTFQEPWLEKARRWLEYAVNNFWDETDGYFHFAAHGTESLIARKKEIFDNVIPGSNSVMALNLYHLGIMLDSARWKRMAERMLAGLRDLITSEPGYLSCWGILMTECIHGLSEIIIVGKEMEARRKELSENYLPFGIQMGAVHDSDLPLFQGRSSADEETRIFVCREKTCLLPVGTVSEALKSLTKK